MLRKFLNQISHLNFVPISVLLYFAALYPSRNHLDTVQILQFSREGVTTDQWTAFYFRYLQLTSIGGNFAPLAAFVGLLSLSFAARYFLYSLDVSLNTKRRSTTLTCFSPFIGVFGMTLTHEVQTVSGCLFLTGLIIRRRVTRNYRINKFFAGVACILCMMTFVGILIVIGFFLAIRDKGNWVKTLLLISLTFLTFGLSSTLLSVERVNPATNLQAVLGDIKCIAQHSDSIISKSQWDLLEKLAPKEKWLESATCSDAQRALFVASKIPGNEIQILKAWINLTKQNPQIVLQARIQRSTMALPPPFFQSQPNFSSRNYLEPVGQGTQDDLQQWSPLFKTSNDDSYQKDHFSKPSFLKPLEYLVLLPAFILNNQSWFWGWGGMWFAIFLLLLITRTRFSYKDIFRISLPHVFTICGLFVGSPISDPRYAMTLTMTGFITSVAFLVDYLARRKLLSN